MSVLRPKAGARARARTREEPGDRARARAGWGSLFGGALVLVFAATTAWAQPGAEGGPGAGEAPPPDQPGRTPTSPALAPPDAAPLTPEELEVLREIEADFERYRGHADAHHARIQAILRREYEDRVAALERRYAERIVDAREEERRRRLDAMALLERFIADYPDHPQFTPDAMFRLANLHLDEASEEADRRFDLMAAGEQLDEDGPGAVADYSKSIELWTRVIRDFPDYRQRAGTLYLLAYYLKQVGEERRSLQVARALVCANKYDPNATPEPAPDRDLVRALIDRGQRQPAVDPYEGCEPATDDEVLVEETWVRIVGDIHFLTPGELAPAIAAYRKVTGSEESRFYDEALYKLAWSHYRNDDMLDAIRAFDASVKYSDELVARGGAPLELRPEALQYIAISFTDPWSIDEQPDPARAFERAHAFYQGRTGEPHVRDVWVQLGETFEILESHDQAIDSFRIALDGWPLHPDNPIIHQRIVSAYEAKGDRDLADREAARLATAYAPGTEWYTANETNREAMEAQSRISERMVRAAAENSHRAAQVARQDYLAEPTPERRQRYLELYRRAAGLYERFIEEYPTSNEIYEFSYRAAETRFFAEEYPAAIAHYRWVRDRHRLSRARFELAALGVVQSYEKEVERRIADGSLAQPPEPTIEQLRQMPKPIRPIPIPELYREWQQALDEYQEIVTDPKSAPTMGYLAGVISYRHLDLEDAARRFEQTFERFCGAEEAVRAKDGLLAIFEATGQDERFRRTNQRFIDKKCGSAEDIQLARAQNRSQEFREAEELSRRGEHQAAADAFFRYYKLAPRDDPNLPVALYNAALNYDRAGKPKTAVHLYKEFTDNRDPAFRDSEYYLTALYLTAVSHHNAFDYDSAVRSFLDVVDAAGHKGRKEPAGIDLSLDQIRLAALYNAAVLRELDRVYSDPRDAPLTGAVSLYRRYARAHPDRAEKDKALWAVARVYESAGDLSSFAKAYADWRSAHGRDPGNEDKVIYGNYRLAKLAEKRGRRADAQRYKRETISAWETVGRPTGTTGASMAAEFAFELAEEAKVKFDRFKIARSPRSENEAKKVLDQLDKLADDTIARYQALARYQSGEWGLAALVRIGDVKFYQGFKIKEIPVPKEIEALDRKQPDKDILFRYQNRIEQLVEPLVNQAAQQWERVVNEGRRHGLANRWTQLAQERLHDFISQERFPVLREEILEGTEEP